MLPLRLCVAMVDVKRMLFACSTLRVLMVVLLLRLLLLQLLFAVMLMVCVCVCVRW